MMADEKTSVAQSGDADSEWHPDNWANQALLLMDDAESLIRWGCVSAEPERYKKAAKAFWDVCHLLAAERKAIEEDRAASQQPSIAALSSSADGGKESAGDAMKLLAAIVDVHDDGMNNAPEDRCYVEGAWAEVLAEARALIAKEKS